MEYNVKNLLKFMLRGWYLREILYLLKFAVNLKCFKKVKSTKIFSVAIVKKKEIG